MDTNYAGAARLSNAVEREPTLFDRFESLISAIGMHLSEANQHLSSAQDRVFGAVPTNQIVGVKTVPPEPQAHAEMIIQRLEYLASDACITADRARFLNTRL